MKSHWQVSVPFCSFLTSRDTYAFEISNNLLSSTNIFSKSSSEWLNQQLHCLVVSGLRFILLWPSGLCSSTMLGYSVGVSTERDQTASATNQSDALFRLKWIAVAFCLGAVILFFVVFSVLQFCSRKNQSHDYEPVPQRLDNGVDKVAPTCQDLEDDEAFVHS